MDVKCPCRLTQRVCSKCIAQLTLVAREETSADHLEAVVKLAIDSFFRYVHDTQVIRDSLPDISVDAGESTIEAVRNDVQQCLSYTWRGFEISFRIVDMKPVQRCKYFELGFRVEYKGSMTVVGLGPRVDFEYVKAVRNIEQSCKKMFAEYIPEAGITLDEGAIVLRCAITYDMVRERICPAGTYTKSAKRGRSND